MTKITKAIRRRLGPLGLSLAAAAVTAIGFAAVSVAQDDDRGQRNGERGDRSERPAPPDGGRMFDQLSDEDKQKLESFRQCMQDEGAPAPPRPGEGDGPPEPPSGEELDRIREAHEACEGELPEQLRNRGLPPLFGHGPCGPPPGEGRERGEQREDGRGQNQEQDYVVPAPAAPGSANA